MLIEWDIALGDHCPDTFIACGLPNLNPNITPLKLKKMWLNNKQQK
jgi:hypothetical protein